MTDWSAVLGSARREAPFNRPSIDHDEERALPLPHRYVHGVFEGTRARFSFYFPPKESYEGRFFHYLSPMPFPETALQEGKGADDMLGFTLRSGSTCVESNQGGFPIPGRELLATNIAVAKLSRIVAEGVYGPHRPFGYVYGGSGGGYKTMSCIENSEDIWDGSVPFVIGTPVSIPCNFTVRAHALRILKGKFDSIVDAVDPGSGRSMYDGLDEEERSALEEVTRFGFPPEDWSMRDAIGTGALPVLSPAIGRMDPTYYADFWNIPGYLGSDPNGSAARARVQFRTRITGVVRPERPKPAADASASSGVDEAWKSLESFDGARDGFSLELEGTPPVSAALEGSYLIFASGGAVGERLPFGSLNGKRFTPGTSFDMSEGMGFLDRIAAGDEVVLDNSDYLALQTFHRHQLPPFGEYPVYDALYRDSKGLPLFPQRPAIVGMAVCEGGAGSLQTGRIHGRMIVVAAKLDESAVPWQADWYRGKVAQALGADYEDSFRIWYIDHALHADSSKPTDPRRVITYLGALQQALLDVSAWVEKGTAPPASTRYDVTEGQVVLLREAYLRKGVQPVARLTVEGAERADISVGSVVHLRAEIEVPPHAGGLVAADWDPEGTGTYEVPAHLDFSGPDGGHATVETMHVFDRSGTFFPALRIASKRQGTSADPFCRIQNLDRVRVVVT